MGGATVVRVKKVENASVRVEARRRVLWRKGTKEVYVYELVARIPGKTMRESKHH